MVEGKQSKESSWIHLFLLEYHPFPEHTDHTFLNCRDGLRFLLQLWLAWPMSLFSNSLGSYRDVSTLGSSVSLWAIQKLSVRRESDRGFDPFCNPHSFFGLMPSTWSCVFRASELCPVLCLPLLCWNQVDSPFCSYLSLWRCRIPELGPWGQM